MIARTQKWYKQIKDNPVKNIVYASCILPFSDLQQAGFEMLLALAEQPWGQEEINKCPRKLVLFIFLNSYLLPYFFHNLCYNFSSTGPCTQKLSSRCHHNKRFKENNY